MDDLKSLPWPLIVGLGSLALVRPVVRIAESQLDLDLSPAVPIVITVVISAIWVAAVGLRRVAEPVPTLVATGLTYAVLSIVLSGILSPILDGELQGPLASPISIVPMLLINALWGLVAGVLALLLQRARGLPPTAGR